MTELISGKDHLLLGILKKKTVINQGLYFLQFCMKFPVPTVLPEYWNIFHYKKFKTEYGIEQSYNASLAYCVPMDTFMTRDPCENYTFLDSNKAFINFKYLQNERILDFYNYQLPIDKKENQNRYWIYFHQKKQPTSKQGTLY